MCFGINKTYKVIMINQYLLLVFLLCPTHWLQRSTPNSTVTLDLMNGPQYEISNPPRIGLRVPLLRNDKFLYCLTIKLKRYLFSLLAKYVNFKCKNCIIYAFYKSKSIVFIQKYTQLLYFLISRCINQG